MITSIRIIATPAGEAPEEIRMAWVGLVLPLGTGKRGQPFNRSGFGVLSGPKTRLGFMMRGLFKKYTNQKYFLVNATTAIEILDQNDPVAAQWWRKNAPHLLNSKWGHFGFEAVVCEMVI